MHKITWELCDILHLQRTIYADQCCGVTTPDVEWLQIHSTFSWHRNGMPTLGRNGMGMELGAPCPEWNGNGKGWVFKLAVSILSCDLQPSHLLNLHQCNPRRQSPLSFLETAVNSLVKVVTPSESAKREALHLVPLGTKMLGTVLGTVVICSDAIARTYNSKHGSHLLLSFPSYWVA